MLIIASSTASRKYPHNHAGSNGATFPDCLKEMDWYEYSLLRGKMFCDEKDENIGIYRVVYAEWWGVADEPEAIQYCGVIYHRDTDFGICHVSKYV
jgi:hypothetical protein